ncbi:SigB/SigF/SigG family RNA polymerase sigma factor [Streptomyces sp. NPDC047108]|uniref:SigB/SigF/SigG family RNA polymerase sigma factor n=1 Tax=Streptomyces sp. NPDC047108 TaxID=3155025 RepID=UPI0033E4CC21
MATAAAQASSNAKRSSAKHSHDDAPDTAAEFQEIARLPEGPEKEHLRQQVVEAWLPMARRLARRFRNRGEPLEDLEQVAALGLVKAVRRYDPGRGLAFASFAVPTVVGEIKRHFRDYTWGVHVPRRVQDARNRVRIARRELSHALDGRAPALVEIAEYTGMTENEVRAGMEALDSYSTLSLDAPVSDSENAFTLADMLGDQETGYDRIVDRESVRPELASLTDRERDVLYLRFFRNMTQHRIAEEVGVSQMHISRIIRRTCETVCDHVMADMRN